MTENDVRVIVYNAFDTYEQDTALPRHQENLANFRKLFALVNKARGAFIAASVFIGVPCSVAALIEIAKFVKGLGL
jgi:hypothetical protein